MVNKESLARITLIRHALAHTSNYMYGLEYARKVRHADTPERIKIRLLDDEIEEELVKFNNMPEDVVRDILAILPEDTHGYFREMQTAAAEYIKRHNIKAQE